MCSRPAISFLLITLQAKYSPVYEFSASSARPQREGCLGNGTDLDVYGFFDDGTT